MSLPAVIILALGLIAFVIVAVVVTSVIRDAMLVARSGMRLARDVSPILTEIQAEAERAQRSLIALQSKAERIQPRKH